MGIKNKLCPLTKNEIDEYSCYLICEAAEGNIPNNEMPGIKEFDIESEICKRCKYHNID